MILSYIYLLHFQLQIAVLNFEASTTTKVESEAPVDWLIKDSNNKLGRAGGRTYSHVTSKICRRDR